MIRGYITYVGQKYILEGHSPTEDPIMVAWRFFEKNSENKFLPQKWLN
jgi:hypothetical protein